MAQTLFRHLSGAVSDGVAEPLPMPWRELERAEVAVRRGQVHLWAAAPGAGKTAVALNYVAAEAVRNSVATLYFSPDSDIMTIGPRMLAILQQQKVRGIFEAFERQQADNFIEAAKHLRHVQWCFEYPLEDTVIELELAAYRAVHGHDPDCIILDNIRDVYSESIDGSDWHQQKFTVNFFKDIAYQTGAAVILLHHLTGGKEDGDKVPRLSDVENKIGKNARQVLCFFAPDEYTIGVHVPKNTNGRRHFDEQYEELPWNRSTQVIG